MARSYPAKGVDKRGSRVVRVVCRCGAKVKPAHWRGNPVIRMDRAILSLPFVTLEEPERRLTLPYTDTGASVVPE